MKKIKLEIYIIEPSDHKLSLYSIVKKDNIIRYLGNGHYEVIKDRLGYLTGIKHV